MATRVDVYTGDGVTPLGLGILVGRVTVYTFQSDSCGCLKSMENPEAKPPVDVIQEMAEAPEKWYLKASMNNPKIILDTGETVYGCQVWWKEIKE